MGHKPGCKWAINRTLVVGRRSRVGGRDLGVHFMHQIHSFCDTLSDGDEHGVHVIQAITMFLHRGHTCCLVVP
jgi:hypothetical protein